MAAAAEAAIEHLVSKAPWHRRWIVRRLLRVMRAGLGLREHPKYLAVQVLDRIRAVAEAAGKDLARAGTLDRADDVWFLTWDELVETNRGRPHLRETVQARRAGFALDRRRQPPLVFASDGEMPTPSPSARQPREGRSAINGLSLFVTESDVTEHPAIGKRASRHAKLHGAGLAATHSGSITRVSERRRVWHVDESVRS